MPRRSEINSILIIGAGPIIIGQACEFDYAGTQACKAIREEGCRIILLNSNPATMMTDPELAEATYIEPITVEVLEKIISIERPDGLLPTLGGQTALNCALQLAKKGVLKKYNVEMIGASQAAIESAENRSLFRQAMIEIGLDVPRAITITCYKETKQALAEIGLPAIIRPSFTLGGSGAGIAQTEDEFMSMCAKAFTTAPLQEITIDESLAGWKEFELEVVRDKNDNCIVVCGIENVDPLGIHTGDSIAVAPIQTLTDKEYQRMRQAAFAVLRKIGVETGGSNVQFAVHPQSGRMVVIEMNPRVSRSSALVSKASGFPIAKIAAKLALGYSLDELKNDITGDRLPASFEPSLDYTVVKIPKFDMQKFPDNNFKRGPQMLSVGEVMAIGRTFTEALQKAIRSLEIDENTFAKLFAHETHDTLKMIILQKTPLQLFAIMEALSRNKLTLKEQTPYISLEELNHLTAIDPWFLSQLNQLIEAENHLRQVQLHQLNQSLLYRYKQIGFSDQRLAALLSCDIKAITKLRDAWNIKPVYKQIDSCAGEFAAPTAYLYSTYEKNNESRDSTKSKVIIIGSGANRIGQGIEFDYCCVHAAKAVKALNYETIMLNCNPETVSTDYDIVDKLYCTPLTFEDIYAIIEFEKPIGVFIQYGGQTPLKLAEQLSNAGVNLLGLTKEIIHQTEDRQAFQAFLQDLGLQQPKNAAVYSLAEGIAAAEKLGFPIIVRPSFVLGGASMRVINDDETLAESLKSIFSQQPKNSVLIETFLQDAIEVDVDAIADGEHVLICGLMEHLELAGVHSGDSASIIPPIQLPLTLQQKIIVQTKLIGNTLKLKGVFNVQFAVRQNDLYIIEVNPRASRTLPFLCKVNGLPLVQIAVHSVFGVPLPYQQIPRLKKYYVKEAVLPFNKFAEANPFLGPEMKSTGEVMGIGATAAEAFAKAQLASGYHLSVKGQVWLIAADLNERDYLHTHLVELGFEVFLNENQPNNAVMLIAVVDFINENQAYINLAQQAVRISIDRGICYATTFQAAKALIEAVKFHQQGEYQIMPIQAIYNQKIHLLSGEELSADEMKKILAQAIHLKINRSSLASTLPLAGKQLAMLFTKPSLRTRFSFTVAMRELGGIL